MITTTANEIDLSPINRIVDDIGGEPDAVIPILQAVQEEYRYLPQEALQRVCELTEITLASIIGVSTFYAQFRHSPVGRYIVKVCHGTACHVSGATEITDEVRRRLQIEPESDTDPERMFTVDEVACLGCCSLAPVIMIEETTAGKLTPASACQAIEAYRMDPPIVSCHSTTPLQRVPGNRSLSGGAVCMRDSNGVEIRIGLGSCGIASGAAAVGDALAAAARQAGADGVVKAVGCNGMCHREPLVEVVNGDGQRVLYGNVSPEFARTIVARHVGPRRVLARTRWLAGDLWDLVSRGGEEQVPLGEQIDPTTGAAGAYLGKQKRIVLENCGQSDPLRIEDYLARGGYQALGWCLKSSSPAEVVETIKKSGLRGRGGAGFPTGRKWSFCQAHPSPIKYVICNGDEGDPGAFMDRLVLEADPHRVLEGLAIAAYAIGAGEGYFYIRAEYPLAVRHIREAIRQAQSRGFLGEGILGTDFCLKLEIREGAGAFVCGEETALMASIEGQRGMPRLRPPFPAEQGLHNQPTNVNNVETLACVPWIIRHGPEAFETLGTETSKGTKVFALAGKVKQGGLIEVPMGITIREVVEEIGGGIKDGRTFKAVQMGGPSGGCIPAALADTPIDYQALAKTGAIMGSGGMVVLDDHDCMVDVARFFLQFTQAESCGKCTFCRIGTKRMLEILEHICEGKGQPGDLETLEELADRVKRTSLCGLGQTAPNPVQTTLKYFRDEYETHLNEKRCPAAKCKSLIRYRVNEECIGCTLCAQVCPVDAIAFRPYEKHEIDETICTRCDMCLQVCPVDSVQVE